MMEESRDGQAVEPRNNAAEDAATAPGTLNKPDLQEVEDRMPEKIGREMAVESVALVCRDPYI